MPTKAKAKATKAKATKAAKAKAKAVAPKAETFKERFKREVVEASKKRNHYVLVKYSAEWCAPCKTFAPVIKRVLAELPVSVTLVTYDIDLPEMVPHLEQQMISAVPTLHLYGRGKKLGINAGTMSRNELIAFLGMHCG